MYPFLTMFGNEIRCYDIYFGQQKVVVFWQIRFSKNNFPACQKKLSVIITLNLIIEDHQKCVDLIILYFYQVVIGRPLFCTDSDSSNNYGLVGIGFQEKISDTNNGVKSFLKGHSFLVHLHYSQHMRPFNNYVDKMSFFVHTKDIKTKWQNSST